MAGPELRDTSRPDITATKAAYEETLQELDKVSDAEWEKGAKFFGQDFTIESAFSTVTGHFEEHRKDVLTGIGRI